MKRYISAVLIPCLLLQFTGCYSSLASGEDINEYLNSGYKVKFVLKNQDYIVSDSDDCTFITEPMFFIYGKGTLVDKKIRKKFEGEIQQENIDSIKSILLGSKNYFVFSLKDSTRISFEENDAVIITHETPLNFWFIKEKDPDSYKILYENDIDEIQVEDRTAYIIVGAVLLVALIVAIVASIETISNLQSW